MKRFLFPKEALQSALPPNESFRYQPLTRPNEIRLVKILPGSRMSPVKCELQPAILGAETPKYVALSYCWGDATQKTWVSCNGLRLALTRDLLNALRRLRRKDEAETLWIDQICINQADLEERGSQVQLMRKIYKSAVNVFIWLGDEADESSKAIKLIPRVSSDVPSRINPDGVRRGEIHSGTPREWRALKALLSRPWFGRMWILQELGVASSATVVCGNQSISWQEVSDMIDHMHSTGSWLILFGSLGYKSSVSAHGRLRSLLSIRNKVSKHGTISSINALWASRDFDATDPRDKIYALIALCVDDGQSTKPDYTKDVQDVYRETALAILFPQDYKISADSSLRFHEHPVMGFLCEAERTDNPYALPSWVPDWRARQYESLWGMMSKNGYKAACSSKTKLALTDDPNKISLAAKIGDAVHLVSSIAPGAEDNLDPSQRDDLSNRVPQSFWINESSSLAASCQRYQDDASRDRAFGSTLIGNKAVENGTYCQTQQQVEENANYALFYWHFRQFLFKLCPNGVVNGAGNPQLRLVLSQHMEGYKSFELAYRQVTEGRRFFISLGGYMGIGPPGMRSGDSICVFLGGNVPWVVRQEGHEYELIGECYVHGIMDGEFMQTVHLPVQDIIVK